MILPTTHTYQELMQRRPSNGRRRGRKREKERAREAVSTSDMVFCIHKLLTVVRSAMHIKRASAKEIVEEWIFVNYVWEITL